MSKLNIKFNNKNYSVDSALLSDATSRLEAHLRSMADERLEGDGQEFHKMAPSTLSFRSTAPLDELVDVKINGEVVDPANYTLTEGSTIVTFPIDYLQGLLQGKHEVTVESQNGSVSGDFTVVEPDLNEYGFYYNQPYTGYVENSKIAFFIKDDGTLNLIDLASGTVIECTYTIDGNNTTITSPMGVFTGSITRDGFYCNELSQSFILGDHSIAADDDYVYLYNEALGGYEVTTINKRKMLYNAIKTGVNGFETVALSDRAFYWNENLVDIPYIPNSVKHIGRDAFFGCDKLTKVIIPKGVETIGVEAFQNLSSVTSLTIPESVLSIGEGAFDSCEALKKLVIPDSVVTIGYGAFRRCLALEEIVIGNSVTSLDNDVFMECPFEHLRRAVIGNSVVGTFSGFGNSKKLKEVIIGNGVSAIGDQAFWGCTSLTDVEFGDNCQLGSIDKSAFEGCVNLKNIVIPDSVTSIGDYAFDGCTGLESIEFEGAVAQWNAISKGSLWNYNVPATHVHCSDGDVAL